MRMESLSELQMYVNLLEKQRNREYNGDYNKLVKDLKYEFNIDTTVDQLQVLFDPTVEEEMLDRQITYNNIFG